jgi:hypothetical protein
METLFATIGVFVSPKVLEYVPLPGGFITGLILNKIFLLLMIVVITLITNIIRSIRYCRDEKENVTSYGAMLGLKKGLTCGAVAMFISMLLGFIPILKWPFAIISFIPGLSGYVDGFILAVFYLLSYFAVAYPIWGWC